jgi:hypothetical protein
MIDSINPFQKAYEVMSKSVDAMVLKTIHSAITAKNIPLEEDEAMTLWPRIQAFVKEKGYEPNLTSVNPMEVRMAQALAFIRDAKRKRAAQTQAQA